MDNFEYAEFVSTRCFPSQIQIARLFDQIYVIQPPMLPPRYDDAPPGEYEYSQPHTSTDGVRPSAPQFPEHLHLLLTHS